MDPTFTHGAEALEAREALAGHIARYTVAVIPETRPDLGTGVLVSSGDALFVATARYVAKDLRLDKVYCIPRPKWIKIIPREEIRRRLSEMEPSERFRLDVEECILSSREDDVALLRLRRRPEELRDMEFYPLERGQSTALPHRNVLVYGYAWDLSLVQRSTGHAVTFPRIVAGELSEGAPTPYDPARDLLIVYEDADPVNAHGMSGGGVWVPPIAGEGMFDPGVMILAGIQVGQFPESRAAGRPLLATRIERVKALLEPKKGG